MKTTMALQHLNRRRLNEGEAVGLKVLWNSMPECASATVLSFL